jgi:putative Ca2+/H+ antiporter (TMEM165/GDT1 family)
MKSRFAYLALFFATVILAVSATTTVETGKADTVATTGKKGNYFSAFVQSFSSIVVSELGDKTFFIAAIMAMRYNRIAVLAGALLALFLMTAISTAFGYIVPTILPASVTHILITVLFFFFGGKLLYDAYNDDGEPNEEANEVEIELNQMHSKLVKSKEKVDDHQEVQIEYIANGENEGLQPRKKDPEVSPGVKKNCATQVEAVASKMVFWQALTMTFLGEWGDRSQISTIALAAESNAVFVFIGGFLGHMLCTTLAVIGGKYLAEKISERTVNICGGILFLLFGIHNLFVGGEH